MPKRLPLVVLLLSLLSLACLGGCARIGVRPASLDDRAAKLDRTALNSDRPSERTLRFVRQRDLEASLAADPETMLAAQDAEARDEKDREALFALAELCYREAVKSKGDPAKAAMFYLSSAVYAYAYLFDDTYRPVLDVYHPYSRQAMEFYNRSLANVLLYARATNLRYAKGKELPWLMGRVRLAERRSELTFSPEEVESFHLAYEFDVRGLTPEQVRLGLGVPVAIVRRPPEGDTLAPAERFIPPVRQTYAATIFLRFAPAADAAKPRNRIYEADFEIHDPMKTDALDVAGRRIPLESDLTTPLAFMMQNTPEPSGLEGMMNPAAWENLTRLYMLQPYDPNKIPVVFVHGLLSSPTTWAPMFNGLMGDPELRARYQFWFFRYPTGNPMLFSAGSLRASLDEARRVFDPDGNNPAFGDMVVVGHSMGGLLTKTLVEDYARRARRHAPHLLFLPPALHHAGGLHRHAPSRLGNGVGHRRQDRPHPHYPAADGAQAFWRGHRRPGPRRQDAGRRPGRRRQDADRRRQPLAQQPGAQDPGRKAPGHALPLHHRQREKGRRRRRHRRRGALLELPPRRRAIGKDRPLRPQRPGPPPGHPRSAAYSAGTLEGCSSAGGAVERGGVPPAAGGLRPPAPPDGKRGRGQAPFSDGRAPVLLVVTRLSHG